MKDRILNRSSHVLTHQNRHLRVWFTKTSLLQVYFWPQDFRAHVLIPLKTGKLQKHASSGRKQNSQVWRCFVRYAKLPSYRWLTVWALLQLVLDLCQPCQFIKLKFQMIDPWQHGLYWILIYVNLVSSLNSSLRFSDDWTLDNMDAIGTRTPFTSTMTVSLTQVSFGISYTVCQPSQ